MGVCGAKVNAKPLAVKTVQCFLILTFSETEAKTVGTQTFRVSIPATDSVTYHWSLEDPGFCLSGRIQSGSSTFNPKRCFPPM